MDIKQNNNVEVEKTNDNVNEAFYEKYNIPSNYSLEDVFNIIPNSKLAYEDFRDNFFEEIS